MNLTKKNRKHLTWILIISAFIGTLVWIIIEEIIHMAGSEFSLQTPRIGFDLQMITFYICLNPGTALGLPAGWLIFKRL